MKHTLRLFVVSVLALCAASVSISPFGRHQVHEQRHPQTRWQKISRASPEQIVPVSIGLTQQNLDRGEQWLYEVSDPSSPKYGKHWSAQDIADAFSPS